MRPAEVAHPGDVRTPASELATFDEELADRTFRTGLVAAAIAVVGQPIWNLFDRLLEPDLAPAFLRVRLLSALLIVVIWIPVLALRRVRWGEAATLASMVSVQWVVAWMLPQVDQIHAYLMGFSVVPSAGALLVDWRRRNLVMVIIASLVAMVLANRAAPDPMDAQTLTVAAIYLGTMAVLALLGHHLRLHSSRREHAARLAAEVARAEAERQREENVALLSRLERLSREDGLTGVANRRSFDLELAARTAAAGAAGTTVGLILVDLDRFKRLNDTSGHQAGDEVLRTVGRLLSQGIRGDDLAARFGGEEFAVLVATPSCDALRLTADSLRSRIAEATAAIGHATTASVGAALLPVHARTAPELVAAADAALYRAKDAGRNRTVIADEPAAGIPADEEPPATAVP